MIKHFASPEHFKASLEARLKGVAKERETRVDRERMLLIFERLIVRVQRHFDGVAILKGGLALEARLSRARSTKDVDLRMMGSPEGLLSRLQVAGQLNLGDYLAYEVEEHPEHPDMIGDGVRYEGVRYRVRCKLAAKVYGDPFGLDIAFGDPIRGEPAVLRGSDLLSFIGIDGPSIPIYPVETHIAEKLHAYTMPRSAPNSRVKDLPDLALLALTGPLEASQVRLAIDETFAFRGTHPVPSQLPEPPEAWALPYARIARENDLRWRDLAAVTDAARRFLDPVLSGAAGTTWSADRWAWSA